MENYKIKNKSNLLIKLEKFKKSVKDCGSMQDFIDKKLKRNL